MEDLSAQDLTQWRDDKEAEIRRNLAHHVQHRTTDMNGQGGLLPPEVYTDPVRFAAEQREIFRKMPMLACLGGDIPQPGDVTLFDGAGPSILVVRAKDGTVNAFLNMCTHRATKLVRECGHVGRMTCPFHGWTFNLDGKLIGVPRKEAFDPESLENRDLIRVPVGEWGGLVFVKATPGDEQIDVKAYLGDFAQSIASIELDRATPVVTGRLDYAANWKYALDTYNEGYHIGVLHAQTVGALYYGDLITVERYGRHHRQSFATTSFSATIGKPESEWPEVIFSPSFFIFPNISINRQPMPGDRALVQIQRILPGRHVGEGYVLMHSYKIGDPVGPEESADYIARHEMIMQVVGEEDFSISKAGYDNLCHAPEGFRSVMGQNEHPAYHVEKYIADEIGMPF